MHKLCLFLCALVVVSSQDTITTRMDLLATAGHVHRLNANAKKYSETSNTHGILQERRVNYGGVDDIRTRAQVALDAVAENENDVSSTCLNHTEIFLEALTNGDTWALRMFDAMGKPPAGILDFNVKWLGSWDECWAVEAAVNRSSVISHPFTGKYCSTSFALGENPDTNMLTSPVLAIQIGVCYPSSCSPEDAVGLVQILESLLPINTTGLPPPTVSCNELDPTYDDKAKVILVVCSLFLALVTIATAYDIVIINWWAKRKNERSELPTKTHYGSFNGHAGNGQVVDYRTPLIGDTKLENGGLALHDKPDSSIEKLKNLQQAHSYKPGLGGKLLLSFSVYTNAPKIFNTKQPAGTLTALNGIRFISMTWVVLGHTFAFIINALDNAASYMPEAESRLSFQVIFNGTFAVDTFFALSGILVSYLSLKEMKKRGGVKKFKWGMFYFHRFWRLTPPYMLVLMTYVPLSKYFANGPMYPQHAGFDQNECRDSWWTNLLYINNFYSQEQMCMPWSWYLSNDMQFYVISPLMLIPLYYSPLWGTVSCMGIVLVTFITSGVTSKHYELGANMLLSTTMEQSKYSFEKLYLKPWCRIGPYAIGFFTGYLLYKTECKVKMSKIVNGIGWLVATALALLILYGLWSPDNENFLSVDMSALYNATSRTMWGVAICWVVFACATGYGGPVNTLLSWPGVIPFSRLTYCAYLVHPVMMYVYNFSHRTPIHFYDLEVAYIFMGNTCMAFALGFVVSLVYESPMVGLEKVLLSRGKTS